MTSDKLRRLAHNDPKLNIKEFWYMMFGELGGQYLVLIHGKNGEVQSTVHAVSKDQYHVVGKEEDFSDLM